MTLPSLHVQCAALADHPEVWTDQEGFGVEGFGFRCISPPLYSSSFSFHFLLSPLDLEVGVDYCRTILRSRCLVLDVTPFATTHKFSTSFPASIRRHAACRWLKCLFYFLFLLTYFMHRVAVVV